MNGLRYVAEQCAATYSLQRPTLLRASKPFLLPTSSRYLALAAFGTLTITKGVVKRIGLHFLRPKEDKRYHQNKPCHDHLLTLQQQRENYEKG
jgi:hypothetical protein